MEKEIENFKTVIFCVKEIYLEEKSNEKLVEDWFGLQKIPVLKFIKNPFVNEKEMSILFFATIASLTLNLKEKKRVVESLCNLNRKACFDLMTVFKEERERFIDLYNENQEDITKLIYAIRREIKDLLEYLIMNMKDEDFENED